MNMQTKMANLLSTVPIPLRNFLYLYGNVNDDSLLYQMNIPLSFGPSTVDLFQISVLENAAGSGDEHGKIQVIDFGSVSLAGTTWMLQVMFRGYFGPLNLGIRMNTTTPASSLHEFKTLIMSATNN